MEMKPVALNQSKVASTPLGGIQKRVLFISVGNIFMESFFSLLAPCDL